jgi:hypothetical protein
MKIMTFALNEKDETTHVDAVPNGKDCGCFCPHCGKPLVAKNKGTIRDHHFAHYEENMCIHGYESSLHLLAKDLFRDAKKIRIPSVESKHIAQGLIIVDEEIANIQNVRLERRINDFVPDIILTFDDASQLAIEILVTHRVDDDKIAKIKKSGINTLEIDLSQYFHAITKEKLSDLLLESTNYKRWLFHREAEVYEGFLQSGAIKKKTKRIGNVDYVINCPKKQRAFFYQGYCLEQEIRCFNCPFNIYKENIDLLSNPNEIQCVGHLIKEGSILKSRREVLINFSKHNLIDQQKIDDISDFNRMSTIVELWLSRGSSRFIAVQNHYSDVVFKIINDPVEKIKQYNKVYGVMIKENKELKNIQIKYFNVPIWTMQKTYKE